MLLLYKFRFSLDIFQAASLIKFFETLPLCDMLRFFWPFICLNDSNSDDNNSHSSDSIKKNNDEDDDGDLLYW